MLWSKAFSTSFFLSSISLLKRTRLALHSEGFPHLFLPLLLYLLCPSLNIPSSYGLYFQSLLGLCFTEDTNRHSGRAIIFKFLSSLYFLWVFSGVIYSLVIRSHMAFFFYFYAIRSLSSVRLFLRFNPHTNGKI